MSAKDPLLAGLVAAASRETTVVTLSTAFEVPVRGLTILEVCRIVARFPTFKRQLLGYLGVGSAESDGFGSILIDAGPDLVGAVLAVAAGRPNDKSLEVAMASLGDVDTLDLLAAVKSQTMPEGLGAFFARLLPTAIRMGLLTTKQAEDLVTKLTKAFEEDPAVSSETTSSISSS